MEVRHESIICPGCGCLCDDLDIRLEDDRIVEVGNVCLWGVSRFFHAKKFHPKKERHRLQEPQVRHQGRRSTVSYEAALAAAAEALSRAQRPLIYGLTNSGSWAQEAALRLARSLGARLEPSDLAYKAPYYQSLQRHGVIWAPLEIIRDEADAVLFWGANPIHSAPRHVVRHAVFARGRFTERGLEDRQVAAVDIYKTELAKFCPLFVKIQPGQELDLIKGVAAALTEKAASNPPVKGTRRLAQFLSKATCGVIFCGRGVSYGPALEWFEHLARLLDFLNGQARFFLFPLSGEFNSTGLYHLLLNEVGQAGAPDFGGAEVAAHFTPVDFREVDAVLVTGADLLWFLPEEQVEDLKQRQVPIVVLSPFANRTTGQAAVILPTALAGIEAKEVAYRMDGLPMVLKQVTPSNLPGDHQVLADLERLIKTQD
ncbi:MAG: molybdopterin-dependent oxidoreductase [Deltaproteobacteria bacterium]